MPVFRTIVLIVCLTVAGVTVALAGGFTSFNDQYNDYNDFCNNDRC